MIMIIAPRPNVIRKAQENRKAVLAALQAKKDAAKAAGKPPPVEDETPDEPDEDEINADVGDDDDEE